jgi:hypothetical protein
MPRSVFNMSHRTPGDPQSGAVPPIQSVMHVPSTGKPIDSVERTQDEELCRLGTAETFVSQAVTNRALASSFRQTRASSE